MKTERDMCTSVISLIKIAMTWRASIQESGKIFKKILLLWSPISGVEYYPPQNGEVINCLLYFSSGLELPLFSVYEFDQPGK